MKRRSQIITKTIAVTLSMNMAFAITPLAVAGAREKKPSFDTESYYMRTGEDLTVELQKNGTAIKNTTWKSSKKTIFTVKKKSNTKAVITGVKKGKAKLKAVVKTKAGKTSRLSVPVEVDDPENSLLTMTKPETPVVDAYLKDVFDKATAEYASEGTYVPVAWLGYKVLGTDMEYLVFARRTPVIAGGKTTYALLTIREGVLGNAVITDMAVMDLEAYISGDPDGWNETETPVIDKTADLVFQQATEGTDGVTVTPLALLATRITNETDYCFIAEYVPVSPEAVPTYNLVYINVNDEGKVKLSKVCNILES